MQTCPQTTVDLNWLIYKPQLGSGTHSCVDAAEEEEEKPLCFCFLAG